MRPLCGGWHAGDCHLHAGEAARVRLHVLLRRQRGRAALQRARLPLPQRVAHLHARAVTLQQSLGMHMRAAALVPLPPASMGLHAACHGTPCNPALDDSAAAGCIGQNGDSQACWLRGLCGSRAAPQDACQIDAYLGMRTSTKSTAHRIMPSQACAPRPGPRRRCAQSPQKRPRSATGRP